MEDNPRNARPAGRVVPYGENLIRFTQDCVVRYGNQVRAFEILELTPDTYVEKEHEHSPILTASGHSWNELGMHHIDPHQLGEGEWIACVDGLSGVK
jgi:hypothetical protein